MKYKNLILGVDPGKDGAIVVIDPNTMQIISKTPFPMVGTKPDFQATMELFDGFESEFVTIYLEEVHAIFGASAKSTFNFGYHAGFLYGVLKEKGFRVEFVQPKVWQKKIWTTSDKVIGPGGRAKPKETSLLAVKRLFPGVDMTPSERSKKFHEGIVDASLIAYYGAKDQYGG